MGLPTISHFKFVWIQYGGNLYANMRTVRWLRIQTLNKKKSLGVKAFKRSKVSARTKYGFYWNNSDLLDHNLEYKGTN